MKSKMKIKKTVVESLVCLSIAFSIGSCAGDGFDEETFSGGVTGTQLLSPEASGVEFAKLAGTTNVKVTWPVIMGAGGYQFSLYIVDDPSNPITVVKDSIIDGASVVCPYLDDTNYKAEIVTLGNAKLNNATATSPTEASWSTLVPATSIPDGADLTTWFADNPVTSGKDTEVAYELAAGGTYTISGDLDFGVNNVQLRGNKLDHAKVKFTGPGSIISCGGGLALKFIEFDCDVVTGGTFLKFGNVPSYGIVTNPMIFQSCEILNVRHYLVNINGKNYAIQNFIIRDCLIKLYQDGDLINFNANSTFVKDFEISNTTFYNVSNANNGRFLRVAGGQASRAGWTSCSMSFTSKTCDNNCYWFDGSLPVNETTGQSTGDKSSTAYGVDPGFADPANGDFTPSAPEVFSHGSGDPRWLK